MRIAHVIDYFQPQLGYQETHLARYQVHEGHDVKVFTSDLVKHTLGTLAPGSQHKARPQVAGCDIEDGIPVERLSATLRVGGRVWLDALEQRLAMFSPEAIHVHSFATLSAYRVARMRTVGSRLRDSVLLVDDHMSEQVSVSWLRAFYPVFRWIAAPRIAASANYIVAVSDASKDFIVRHYGLSPPQIRVIRLGVDPQVFRPDPAARAAVRTQLALPSDAVLFIYTGKLTAVKRLEMLLDASYRLGDVYPNLHLLFVGYGEPDYVAALQHRLTGSAQYDRTHWLPAVPSNDLGRYFAAADVAVWPAQHSISFMEAMACGLPLVVSDAPKCKEEVAYDNGFVFPMEEQYALSEAMCKLMDDASLRHRMGAASLAAVKQHYTWDMINRQFMACYEQR